MATWAQKFPGTLSPICQADWPQHCPQYRGLFWWQSGPQNFQALWLQSSRQTGPKIACNIRGSFAGNVGPKTSRHFGSNLPGKLAPTLPAILGALLLAIWAPKLPGTLAPMLPPILEAFLLAGLGQNFQAPQNPHLRPKVGGTPRIWLGTSVSLVAKCKACAKHVAAQKYIPCYAYSNMCSYPLVTP